LGSARQGVEQDEQLRAIMQDLIAYPDCHAGFVLKGQLFF